MYQLNQTPQAVTFGPHPELVNMESHKNEGGGEEEDDDDDEDYDS